jgi:hypothetical protein
MKSTDNRYKPPRIQYNIDSWARKKPMAGKDPLVARQDKKFGRKKKQKP